MERFGIQGWGKLCLNLCTAPAVSKLSLAYTFALGWPEPAIHVVLRRVLGAFLWPGCPSFPVHGIPPHEVPWVWDTERSDFRSLGLILCYIKV